MILSAITRPILDTDFNNLSYKLGIGETITGTLSKIISADRY